MNVEETIRQYLPDVVHMSLGTCSGTRPWVCEVHYAYDENLNFYFRSKKQRRHSLEIEKNKYVAGNIVAQHVVGEKVRGVYFEGVATMLEDVNEEHVDYKLYCERFNTGAEILEEAREENGHMFYQISVETFCLFDSRESSPSQKYELSWGKK